MTNIKNLPSWVPDYSTPAIPEPLSLRSPNRKWNASEGILWISDQWSMDDSRLKIQGKFLGSVEDVSMDPLTWREDKSAQFWCAICRSRVAYLYHIRPSLVCKSKFIVLHFVFTKHLFPLH